MLKIRGQLTDGRPMIVLGLSHGNLDLLRLGKSIAFDLREIGLEGMVLIFAGATEEAMLAELAGTATEAGVPIKDGQPPPGSVRKQ